VEDHGCKDDLPHQGQRCVMIRFVDQWLDSLRFLEVLRMECKDSHSVCRFEAYCAGRLGC
jgi:hypothetical protein